MSTIYKTSALLSAGALFFLAVASLPAAAASPTTGTFLTDVNLSVDFLDRSSRMALDNSKSPQIRTFARSEAAEQTHTLNAFYDWSQKDAAPVAIASNAGTDGLLTGRSVAIDKPVKVAAPQIATDHSEDIDRLYGLTGSEFDESFKAAQVTTLTQLVSIYQEYITNGDEPALKTMATRELPKINRRLAELRRL